MPDHWQETTLGEVGEVNPKEAPLAEDAPFVPMDAVNVGQRWVEYTEPRGTRSGARARAGDVLFARITPCLENGKTAQVQNEIDRCGGSTEFIVLRGTERLDPDFLYFWATDQNVRERAANLMTGSTGRQRLSPKDLAAMTLSVPPISEQRRIVDLVGSIDTYIDSLETQIETTRTARNGLSIRLLSEVVESGETSSVEDLISIQRGHDLPKKDRMDGEVVVAASSGPVGSHNESKGPVPGVVTGRSGTIGRVMVYTAPYWPLNTSLYVTDFKGSDPFFVAEVLRWMRLERFAGGGAVPSLDRKVLYREMVPKPSIERQREIVSLLQSIDEQVSSLESQVESVRALRSGVLSELLSGERLLDDSYDRAVGL